ncbi:MAG: DNA recombination protein RmuC, partial [Bdellovibrionales bacterium]|nr:DNA recombination protein RmuC [Bdellovibrionales bacterium]NQZ19476.1 DNA recombination protein RmuC [Bdellovibrionales bacterium]
VRHGKQVKDHVKKLSLKSYGEVLEDSADFTVMFLPNESFLYAALETQADIVEYAMEKKILIATPPTFVGLLKVIRYGWNEEKLNENAAEISKIGKELHKRISDFMEAYFDIGKNLQQAQDKYDTGLKRLNSRVLVQAKKMESLGAKSHKDIPLDH